MAIAAYHSGSGLPGRGMPSFSGTDGASIPLTSFGRLARIPGVQIISLQVGNGREQIAELTDRFPLIDLGEELDQQAGAFMDTAAVMKNVDLVIGSDSAVAHLAGTLGVPVWVPLSYSPDWRWLSEHRTARGIRRCDYSAKPGLAIGMRRSSESRPLSKNGSRRRPGRRWSSGYCSRAVEHLQSGRTEEARGTCDELLAIEPSQPDGLNLRGILSHQAGRSGESEQFLHRAIHAASCGCDFPL